ncbi:MULTISPECIES: MFS transporter [Rhodococcus]|uniref:Major facilitator superfamily (MFS) profile domain-containing protein n=1 Tax=Rhodococcus aetherivorans TaxID=191292 RepID=A0ABQ0YMZ8_9NOCA|nr:MFS transporter [Rhodococcus aetherivorans]ETT24612.1 major facilitator superfamily MFS_1 [Rhodococcus rhodochrous ATCC 21198]NCL76376.1 putative MFS-type transporter EfpA [Rhodococcus sp. YH1]AKE88606.1 major facilitator transporter [Rhodococcus aetherivorans]KDE14750.1 major facilitator transporter [Rhodococcus aetherivorans]MDV6297180.1 MFS transporter [Rhodococcus aetherivorans]
MESQSQVSVRIGPLLAVLSGAPFVASLDLFVLNVALGDIGTSYPGSSLGELSWVLSGYAIVYAALLVPLGRWADRIGRRRGFLAGLGLFTVASAACALSPSLWVLVICRLFQAVGAAALTPASLGLLVSAVPEARRAGAVRIWAATGAAAAAFGPVVGGLLVEVSWRWAFLINVPIGILLLAVARRVVPDIRPVDSGTRLDLAGAALLTLGIGALALGLVQGPEWGWADVRILAAFVVAAGALLLFAHVNARHPAPLIEPSLLAVRSFSWSNVTALIFSATFAAGLLANVLWVQQVWGYSALRTGLAVAPGPLMVPLFAAVGQVLARRFTPGAIAAAGCVLWGAGAGLVLATVGPEPEYATALLPGWLIGGVGVGLALPTILSAATAQLPPARTATGSAIVTMSRQLGTVLGISVLVAILGAGDDAVSAFRFSWWTIAAVAVVAALAAGGMTPRPSTPEVKVLA